MGTVRVKAELFVDEAVLKENYSYDDYSLEAAIGSEMHWAGDSGIWLESFEIAEDKIQAVLSVDEDILRENFLECHSETDYTFADAFEAEMHWVYESGITMGDFEIIDGCSKDVFSV